MGLLGRFRSIYNACRSVVRNVNNVQNRSYQLTELLLQQHVTNLLGSERHAEPGRLNRHEFKVFSQSGEDGVLAEVFRRVMTTSRTFVEIGTGPGSETNTTFLLLQGWSGYWIEGSAADVRRAEQHFAGVIAEKRLTVSQQFVTAENVEQLLDGLAVPAEFDLLSLDIDRNTYWVWNAIRKYKPRVVVVEYNAHLPPDVDWKVTYRPQLAWNNTIHFGASLKAYEVLGRELGYRLVGCSLSGVNAFFVQEELCSDAFLEPATAENHYEPLRHYLAGGTTGYPPCFTDVPDE